MFKRLRKKWLVLAVTALTVAGIGMAVPAFADPESSYKPSETMLTKIIDAPEGTDTSQDTYVFHFAGGGVVVDGDTSVGQSIGRIYSDGVEQDTTTIKVGDVVPTIGDVELNGVQLTADNTLTNGQTSQTVVQISLSEILNGVAFPHAGVYTYEVTETSVVSGSYVNASKAAYRLRIYVENGESTPVVGSLTVERMKNDNGDAVDGKVDPTYPKTANGKITEISSGVSPAENTLAGDTRGRNVAGFTFANEYIKSGSFVVKKLYDGDYSDKTRYSTVEVAIYSEAVKSADANGTCLTYVIDGGGIDLTSNVTDGERATLNGVYGITQTSDYMVTFGDDGWAYITADLKEGSSIRITGVFGRYDDAYANEAPNGRDKRMTLSTDGLVEGMQYFVFEKSPGDYRPTGYVLYGDSSSADPRVSHVGMDEFTWDDDPRDVTLIEGRTVELPPFALYVNGSANGQDTTVFVVNNMDNNKVSITGILIDNLPYILMVGGPLAIFAGAFVYKRRKSAEA